MIKTYVLDTNILIQAPYAVHCFEDNQIVLPVAVLEELDNLKKSEGEKGAGTWGKPAGGEKFRGYCTASRSS